MSSVENLKFALKSIRDSGILDGAALEGLTESERETVEIVYRENLVSEALEFLEDMVGVISSQKKRK